MSVTMIITVNGKKMNVQLDEKGEVTAYWLDNKDKRSIVSDEKVQVLAMVARMLGSYGFGETLTEP